MVHLHIGLALARRAYTSHVTSQEQRLSQSEPSQTDVYMLAARDGSPRLAQHTHHYKKLFFTDHQEYMHE